MSHRCTGVISEFGEDDDDEWMGFGALCYPVKQSFCDTLGPVLVPYRSVFSRRWSVAGILNCLQRQHHDLTYNRDITDHTACC
jgi:hypothetical protein